MASAQLHDALKCLRPKNFASDIPLDDLEGFMRDIFSNAEIIVNSVPQPPGGSDFLSSKPKRTDVNGAHNASEMTISDARAPPLDPSFEDLQKSWGKPIKANPNPLSVAAYKMAGADRYGSWFARRSVHEGLGFTKWKKALQREFATSLAVQGGPGSGSVRGIGGDRRLEEKVVDGLGKLEVLQLSAKFPAPTAPREFITMLLTSDNALSEKSKPHVQDQAASKQIPRHYMIVSIPCEHPEAAVRDGLVRGQYESVEMIREIPLTPAKSRKDGSTERREEASPDDPETNPVEWIMITRSDPGGGIPRFLIDRGTPGSIVADTSKFLDWACAQDEIEDPEKDAHGETSADTSQQALEAAEEAAPRESFSAASRNVQLTGVGTSIADRPLTNPSSIKSNRNGSGIFSSVRDAVGNGIQNYAPQSVASYLQPNMPDSSPSSESDTVSDKSSLLSFASAEQWATADGGPPEEENPPALPPRRTSNESVDSTLTKSHSSQNRYDKELAKLDSKRAALDDKMRKMREKEEARTQQISEREEREKRKAMERYEREIAKLEAKREKEARKLRERKKKEEDKSAVNRMQRERDEFKERAEMAERENRLLKEQIGELQQQNTLLVQRVGKTQEGKQALKAISSELARGRSGSTASSAKSKSSKKSTE